VLLCVSSSLWAAAPPAPAPAATTVPANPGGQPELIFEKYQLPNGLTVILSEDHRLPQVAVNVWYHVGAANQVPHRSGFAHLFEHMMFSGAKHLPKPPIQLLESVGVSTSAMNGTTDFDRTNYFEVVPSQYLPLALWMESERMGFLLDTLDAKKLQIQREVVSNERRQRYENRPYGPSQIELCDLLYPKPHPYYGCVIGEISEIQNASLDDVRDFFRTFYNPSNASISIVGDFDPKTARELMQKYFGTLPAGPPVMAPVAPLMPSLGVLKKQLEDPRAAVPRVTLAWRGTKPYSADDTAGDMLSYILGQGHTSRLYRNLVQTQQIAGEVYSSNNSLRLGGYFTVVATALKGHSSDSLRESMLKIVRDIRDHGPTPQEVERARHQLLAARLRQMERIGGFGGKADLLNELEMYTGDPGSLPKYLAEIRKIRPVDIQNFAKRYLLEDQRLELTVIPQKEPPVPADTVPTTSPPAPSTPPAATPSITPTTAAPAAAKTSGKGTP
jgi:zinc protease